MLRFPLSKVSLDPDGCLISLGWYSPAKQYRVLGPDALDDISSSLVGL